MTTTAATWTDGLRALDACRDAVEWAETQPSLAAAWQVCDRGDWMLWLLGRVMGALGSEAHRALMLSACACARLALPYVAAGDTRPLTAIETAERWARGEEGVTLADVRVAAAAAAADARSQMLARCADIVRQHYPSAPTLAVSRGDQEE